MAVTPLIKPISNKKGIFYNFQSALEDINTTLSNSENAIRFSKFALLRIPEIGTPNYLPTDNKIQFLAQGESFILEGLNAENNVNLAQSFQSYALNFEALLLNRPSYRRENKLTVSERVFWKWLKELGAIRFQNANQLEKNVSVLGSEARFVEKPETNSTYKRVVQYVADIDVVNTVKSNANSYTEIYIHVPTNVGSTPHVLFKSLKDENYFPNMTVANTAANPLDIEYLTGRKYNEVHPFGLSMKAYYDLDDQAALTQIKNSFTGNYAPGNWFNKTIRNSYYTDNYNNTGEYNVASDQFISKQYNFINVEYQRSTLDGISIDFDLQNYKLASENPEIKVFSQFNDYVANRDFEFNAVLIYYDTFDPDNLDVDGSPLDFRTNLYGVLFLDKVQQNGLEFQIPPISKFKPDPLNKSNGNSFSFKLNLKLDTSVENVLVEKSINDYSTFSMDLFLDVLTEFRTLQTAYSSKFLEIEQLKQDIENLKGTLLDTESQQELSIRLTNVETSLSENSALFGNTNEVINLISSVNERVDSVINGKSNVNISYNIDAVRPGKGIAIDRKTLNKVNIVNINQQYNLPTNPITNIFTNNVIQLVDYANYVAHTNSGDQITLTRDLEIFINDSNSAWKRGQTLRLVFDDPLFPDIYDVKIKTDYLNITNNGQYGITISTLNYLSFGQSNKPIFDIICLDEKSLTFKIDKIR
jgi:hypothetical protein